MKKIVFVILNRGKGNTADAHEVMIISDNTKEGSGGGVTEQQLADGLSQKVDKDGSKVLSEVNFSSEKDAKLNGIANNATANQSDSVTNEAIALKAPINSPTFTGTVSGVTKSMVGLGSVDNTSDSAKPISTAQQTAFDGKMSIFYKSSAPFAPFSGAGVETIVGIIPINPSKLRNNTASLAKAFIRKNNAVSSGFTLTMYLNTAPNLSGATPLRSSHTTSGTVMSSSFETEFWVEDNLMKVPNATTISNVGISATVVNEIPFNPANQYYIIITGNPGGNTAEIQCKIAQLIGTY